MLNLKRISEVYDLKVFTDQGEYFGAVDEAIIQNNKIFGWKIRATKESYLNKSISGSGIKGVIVPHQLTKAIGDIMIVSKTDVVSPEAETTEVE